MVFFVQNQPPHQIFKGREVAWTLRNELRKQQSDFLIFRALEINTVSKSESCCDVSWCLLHSFWILARTARIFWACSHVKLLMKQDLAALASGLGAHICPSCSYSTVIWVKNLMVVGHTELSCPFFAASRVSHWVHLAVSGPQPVSWTALSTGAATPSPNAASVTLFGWRTSSRCRWGMAKVTVVCESSLALLAFRRQIESVARGSLCKRCLIAHCDTAVPELVSQST